MKTQRMRWRRGGQHEDVEDNMKIRECVGVGMVGTWGKKGQQSSGTEVNSP